MQPISADFIAALKQPHKIATSVEILQSGEVIAVLDVTLNGEVPVEKGAEIRRRCNVSFVDEDGTLTPGSAADLLTPYGNEVRLYRGIDLGVTPELIALGTFRISAVTIQDSEGGLSVTIEGYDRARTVQRARFENPYVIAAGTNYVTAIRNLINDRRPGTQFEFPTSTRTTPLIVLDEQGDPWKEAIDMAASIGMELFFDPMGVCTMRPEPSPTIEPVHWEYFEGPEATILDVGRAIADERAYNGAIVTGEGTNAKGDGTNAGAARAVVWDTDPLSPTYYLGRYGKVPIFYSSEFITTNAQAMDAATGILRRSKGATEQVEFAAIVNPAHDSGDVVRVRRSRAKVDSTFMLDSFSLPLGVEGAMRAKAREVRVS